MNSAEAIWGKLESLRHVDKCPYSDPIAARLMARWGPSAIHVRLLILRLGTYNLFFHFEMTDSEIYTVARKLGCMYVDHYEPFGRNIRFWSNYLWTKIILWTKTDTVLTATPSNGPNLRLGLSLFKYHANDLFNLGGTQCISTQLLVGSLSILSTVQPLTTFCNIFRLNRE